MNQLSAAIIAVGYPIKGSCQFWFFGRDKLYLLYRGSKYGFYLLYWKYY